MAAGLQAIQRPTESFRSPLLGAQEPGNACGAIPQGGGATASAAASSIQQARGSSGPEDGMGPSIYIIMIDMVSSLALHIYGVDIRIYVLSICMQIVC